MDYLCCSRKGWWYLITFWILIANWLSWLFFTGTFHLVFYNTTNNFIASDSSSSPPHRDGMLMMTGTLVLSFSFMKTLPFCEPMDFPQIYGFVLSELEHPGNCTDGPELFYPLRVLILTDICSSVTLWNCLRGTSSGHQSTHRFPSSSQQMITNLIASNNGKFILLLIWRLKFWSQGVAWAIFFPKTTYEITPFFLVASGRWDKS